MSDSPTDDSLPHPEASRSAHPIHATLGRIPIVCFAGTLVTDIVYWRTARMLWADMSAWLLVVGVVFSVLAVAAALFDFFAGRHVQDRRAAWIHSGGNSVALVLSIINALIHSRDAYTSVVPAGLVLSVLVVAILIVTDWHEGRT